MQKAEAVVTQHVTVASGEVWTINLRGDCLQIVDASGRERHRSRGHMMTGAHLAMLLAETTFESTPNLDEAMKRAADKFTANEE